MESIQIVSLNVRGLENKNKETEYFNFSKQKNSTLYCCKKHIALYKTKTNGKRNGKAPPFSPLSATTNVE